MPSRIELVAVGPVEESVTRNLPASLAERFHAPVRRGDPLPIDYSWFDSSRNQFQADAILDALVARRPEHHWILGIIDADLFVPGLNFIFGQATVGGCCAIIALARLRGQFYHERPDPARFQHRVLIEAAHELGHIAGLDHCPDPACVMHFSESIQESDAKGPDFCSRCSP